MGKAQDTSSGQGILIVVSGFSGAGKGTVMKKLMQEYDGYALSVSATTRAPREDEEHGREYFFIDRETFLGMIENEALYEYAEYNGNFYGTPRAYVDEQRECGRDVILEIEVQGAEKIKKTFPDTVLIFVTPPTAKELKDRLIGRGSETPEAVCARLSRAAEEAKYMPFYDYVLVNDDLDRCVRELNAIIKSEHMKAGRNKELILRITDELRTITTD